MGSSANVNAFFGIMTMIIAVPTGVKVFDWLFTMYRGRIEMSVPMLWTIGFIVTFVIGGMSGVLLAIPPVDYLMHNSTFLVAHFHNMLIPGALFGYFAGYMYWFPKAFGFKLDDTWGRRAFWLWISGFYLAFMPLYVLGFMGMSRRMEHYDMPGWQPWLIAAALGAFLIAAGILCMIIQLYVSVKNREALADTTGDPWGGRTLEWATASPPAPYNFARIPVVHDRDELIWRKEHGEGADKDDIATPIELPENTGHGVIIGVVAGILGFAMIWHIWWLAVVSLIVILATVVMRSFQDESEQDLTDSDIAALEKRGSGPLVGY